MEGSHYPFPLILFKNHKIESNPGMQSKGSCSPNRGFISMILGLWFGVIKIWAMLMPMHSSEIFESNCNFFSANFWVLKYGSHGTLHQ